MYRLQPLESPEAALGRIASEELALALEWLGGADRALILRVHETRKHIKRLRALFALVRGSVEAAHVQAPTLALRAAATALSEPRARAAMLECYQDLVERFPEVWDARSSTRVREALEARLFSEQQAAPSIAEALTWLARTRVEVRELKLQKVGFAAFERGFRRVYAAARNAYDLSLCDGRVEHFHALRTRQKRHLYHVELLEPVWPGPLRALRAELDRLGELLGEHHDLSLFAAELRHPLRLDAEVDALDVVATQRLRKLERESHSIGARVFAERPRVLSERVAAYFSAFRE